MTELFESDIIKTFSGKQVLITGGAGYIATKLVQLLRNVDCRIIRLDRPDAVFSDVEGKARIDNISGDIRVSDVWGKVLDKTDFVFHFAAQTSTYTANENPVADAEINVSPMLNLLETCRKKKTKPIVLFSSTVTVIGLPSKLPVDENCTGEPVTVYDLHKLIAEKYLNYYISQGAVSGAVLRLSNVYGPGPKSSKSDRGILNLMIRKALAAETLTVYGQGDYLRDYVYVEDVARAFIMAAIKNKNTNGRYFVIGSGQGHTITEAVNLVADRTAVKTGRRVEVIHIEPQSPQSPIEMRNFVADSGQFSSATGWKANVSLIEGIDRTIEGY